MAVTSTHSKPPPVTDTRSSWLVALASLVIHALNTGYYSSFGGFLYHWQEEFGATATEVSWVSVVFGVMSSFSGVPAGSLISRRYGCRTTMITAGILFASSLVCIGLCTELWQIYLATVLLSCGWGFGYQASVNVLIYHFDLHLSKANSVAFSGGGIGAIAFPPFCEFLTHRYSWQGAFFILAPIYLIFVVCGILMRPNAKEISLIRESKDSKDFQQTGTHNEEESSKFKLFLRFLKLDVLTNHHALLIFISYAVLGFGYFASTVYIVMRIEDDLTVDTQQASLAVSSSGIGAFLGRLLHGVLIDAGVISPTALYCLSTAICGISMFSFPLTYNFWVVMFITFVFGVTTGVSVAITPITLTAVVPPSQFSTAFGIAMAFFGIGTFAGSFLLAALFDATNSFKVSYFTSGSVLLFGALAMGLENFLQQIINRELERTAKDGEDAKKEKDAPTLKSCDI